MEQDEELKDLFERNKALLNGHFQLSSGLHSDVYFQSALILQHPKIAAYLAQALAKKIKNHNITVDVVASPALGGIIVGHEIARALDVRAIFLERIDGNMSLRRGFSVDEREKVLVVEDVITTGLSTKEVIKSLELVNAKIVAVASLVDRSAGKTNFGVVPKISLLSLEVNNYKSQECPMCKRSNNAAIKLGSRK